MPAGREAGRLEGRVTLAFDLQHILFHEGKLHALRSCDHLVEQVFDDGKLSSGSR